MKDAESSNAIAVRVQDILATGATAVLVTIIKAPIQVGEKMIVEAGGSLHGTFGSSAIDAAITRQANIFLASKHDTGTFFGREFAPNLSSFNDAQFLFELIQPEPRVVICGAGHVGAALARFASLLGYHTTLIDDRIDFLRAEDFPEENIEPMLAENWAKTTGDSIGNGRGVSVAIVTRGHSEDEQCLRAALSSGDPDYVGLIGSKRRTRIVLERLRAAGIAEEKLQHVHAPIGLDIGAVTPEEVALAIIAEMVAVRRGGKATSLKDRKS